MNKLILQWTSLAILAMLATVSQAALIASDSFAISAGVNDYVPFTGIEGQNPTDGSSGFDSGWNTAFTSAFQCFPGGMTHSLTPGTSLEGHLKSGSFDGHVAPRTRNLSRSMDYTPSDGTYYISFLLHKYAATNRDHLFAGLSPLQYSEEFVSTVQGTYIGHYDGGISFFNGPGAAITTVLPSSQMHVDETYFALMQIDYSTTDTDSVMVSIYDGLSAEVANPTFSNLNLDDSMGRFGVLTQNFGTRPGLDEFRFGTELSDVMVITGNPCDFNNDDNCNITDLNLLLAEGPVKPGVTVTPGVNGQFDLNGDGEINNSDVNEWLGMAANENDLGSPYKSGDANLDGVVDVSDFNSWNENKFTSTLLWDNGDFNGDGVADVSDFNLWTSAKFTASDGTSAVPEPATGIMLSFVALALLGVTRKFR